MSEGKMELHNVNGQVFRFDPSTGKTWQIHYEGFEAVRWVPIEEPDDAGADDEDDGGDGPRLTITLGASYQPFHELGDVPGLYSGYEHPSTEQYEGSSILKSAIRANLDPAMLPWRDLLRAGAAPEPTQGTIPTASPIPDTRGTVRFIGQRKATDEGEQPDEKPEPDYRSEAAWE